VILGGKFLQLGGNFAAQLTLILGHAFIAGKDSKYK